MTAANPPELANALLQWAKTFKTARRIERFEDLKDGEALWEMLRDIDPDYFDDSLPESLARGGDSWIPKWQNLKHVNRLVNSYLRDVCGTLEEPNKDMTPDLKAIATSASMHDTIVLLKNILRAAMYSPESNQRMGRIVVSLGPDVAKPIAAAMAEMEDLDQQNADARKTAEAGGATDQDSDSDSAPSTRGTSVERDPALEQEEKLIHAYKLIKRMEMSNAEAASKLEQLRQDKESLQDAFDSFKANVESEEQRKKEDDEKLQGRAYRDSDYIAQLEDELESTRTTVETQTRQLELSKHEAGDVQKLLRDDIQALRKEKDELLQQSHASENLRKKIQTLQDQEAHHATLREDLKAAQEQVAALQKANEENLTTIANGEQEIFDQKSGKKRLDHEYKVLMQRYDVARERGVKDQERIAELEDGQHGAEVDETPADERAAGLEDELAAKEAASIAAARVGELEATISGLREELEAVEARAAVIPEEPPTVDALTEPADAPIVPSTAAPIAPSVETPTALPIETPTEAASQAELAALKRENKLMTSAWYGLANRLQSNTVMVARRREEPKSWIAKQRAAVSHSVTLNRR